MTIEPYHSRFGPTASHLIPVQAILRPKASDQWRLQNAAARTPILQRS